MQSLAPNNAEDYRKEAMAKEAEHQAQLDEVKEALAHERELRIKLEEDMRQAFMRGGEERGGIEAGVDERRWIEDGWGEKITPSEYTRGGYTHQVQ